MDTVATNGLIGASVKRVEDPRFLTGQGRYIADLKLPNMAHAAFLRSPQAHARIIRVDTSRARALAGVVAVFTAADLAGTVNPIVGDNPMPGMKRLTHTALATQTVRLVGDLVAVVVAEDRYLAEDAVDLIEVTYESLPPVPDVQTALDPASARLYDECGDNIAYHDRVRFGQVDSAFDAADRVISRVLRQHRYQAAPLETRGGVADYLPASGALTYHVSMHAPHLMRNILSNQLNLPLHQVRVLVPDIGGSFGQKWGVYREDMLVCAASIRTGRPVKWIEDRTENLTAAGHAREETVTLDAAVHDDGTLAGLRVKVVMDVGAFTVTPMNPAFFTIIMRMILPGPYRLPAYEFEATTVLTNKAPYVAYRGPWAVETWVREVLMDIIAKELGLDPIAVRLTNIPAPADQPMRTVMGYKLDGTSARATLTRAVELADLPRFRVEQRRLREQGRLVGFGLATSVEPAPGRPDFLALTGGGRESAQVRVEPTGQATLFTSQIPHGQGHETTLAQVVASELGVPLDQVTVVHGDTRATPFSMVGTGGSRAATLGSGAALRAARDVKQQILRLASGMFGAEPGDMELADAIIYVRGAPQGGIPLNRITNMVYLAPTFLPAGSPAELVGTATYDGEEGGFSQATHCCWVEVDPDTGTVEITRYLVVEDCGAMINPAVVEGQIRGGTAQGIGGVLYEHAVYNDDGQCLSTTFRDYLLPGPPDVPHIEIEHLTSSKTGPVDFRGVGEGGAICAPPAVTNAVSDALGIEITQQSITPAFILEALGKLPAKW